MSDIERLRALSKRTFLDLNLSENSMALLEAADEIGRLRKKYNGLVGFVREELLSAEEKVRNGTWQKVEIESEEAG